ncbi:glutathione S-transferase family protein [Phenylobacterium sp.]|uniref:glutathione S-transferase family protein n=1 Tax=Phenylobacterium sp. TaxID=1871053 RepID=UPI001208EF3D|nr:glutathione S-transferase family protein [Phenylobacterium sp.]THD62221.1 MAG: glutathione S-transferase family protein [Phenylobacterium sp.]
MIVLSTFGPLWGVPDPSPFVIKTEVQLKMSGLAYRTERWRPTEGPKGKVPFIVDGPEKIGDSVFIRDHLQWTYGIDLDAGLSPRERALGWTVERMMEDHVYWAIVYARWAVRENFDKGPSIFFAGAPEEVREAAFERMGQVLHGQGFGRHSLEEVADLAGRSFAAAALLLGEGPYLAGKTMGGADASLFAGVAAAAAPHFDSPVRDAVLQHPNLIAYRDRMMARFYPQMARARAA